MSYGQNYSIFDDLYELERMVKSFKNYLKGKELYGSVGGGFFTGGGMPSITVGAIQMRIRRLTALQSQLDPTRQIQFAELVTQHNRIRDEQYKSYADKLEREATSRLDAISTFFDECREEPTACPRIYPPEVLRRTVVQELLLLMHDLNISPTELSDKIRKTDRRLKGYLQDSDFVWDAQLQNIYPRDPFWWMWMAPQG